MDKRWEPVALLASSLQEQLHHPVDVNLYFTPPQTISSSAHFDVMDSFILQLEGSKIWDVHEPVIPLPLPDEQMQIPQDRLPPLAMREELQEGDVLYLPRGYVHFPRTTNIASLHLTVGVNVLTWIDLFSAAVSAARDDRRFRMALPPSFLDGASGMREQFSGLLEDLSGHLDMDEALNRLAERLIVGMTTPPGDEYAADEVELKEDTLLARRKGVICRALEGPGYAAIQYTGGKILGPVKIGNALRLIAEHRTFTIRDLPDDLNEQERVLLVRRLIRGGLLEVRGK
jgi:ribosomal protein L16 Arg81 hydroxylase